jgi:hypothetical protein
VAGLTLRICELCQKEKAMGRRVRTAAKRDAIYISICRSCRVKNRTYIGVTHDEMLELMREADRR